MVKLLFLPHCLKESLLEDIKHYGEKKGYEVYVVGGGSRVKKIIEETGHNINRIVGVACEDEITLAKEYFNKTNFDSKKVFSVSLSEDGCKNTSVDLEKVLEVLD
ncbi:MAG: DUF116 domain-containing protein [Candidatus Pacearchaeota archaeon]